MKSNFVNNNLAMHHYIIICSVSFSVIRPSIRFIIQTTALRRNKLLSIRIHSFYRLKSGFSSVRTVAVVYVLSSSVCMRASIRRLFSIWRPINLDRQKSCFLYRCQKIICIPLCDFQPYKADGFPAEAC